MAKQPALLNGKEVTLHTSPKGKLTWRDIGKGSVMASLMGALTAAEQLFDHGAFTTSSLHTIGLAAGGAFCAYLFKQFVTDAKTVKETAS